MSMTRKHFAAIAEAMQKAQQYAYDGASAHVVVNYTAIRLSETLAQFNPHFDRQRFLDACQVNTEEA